IDLDKLRAWKEGVVNRLTGGLGQLSKQRKVDFIRGRAAFLDSRTLKIEGQDEERRLVLDNAILATGSRPASPPALSLDSPRVMDSTAALELDDIPQTMLVIGGGYIGLELGTVYAALGTQVSLVEMTSGLLPGVDRDLVSILARRVDKTFYSVMLNARVVEMTEEKNGVRVRIEGAGIGGGEGGYEKGLVGGGRGPHSSRPRLGEKKEIVYARGVVPVEAARRP